MNDLGGSLQKLAGQDGSTLNDAIAEAKDTGNPVDITMTGVKAGGGFDGKTSIGQKGAIGRFSVAVTGTVTVDKKGNWHMTGSVTGEVDRQDYPADSRRTGIASALTAWGASQQAKHGGKDYDISFYGSQSISINGQ